MSKYVKNLIADDLRQRLQNVHDALLVNMVGLNANANTRLRAELRSKNIHVMVIKNSLAARATEGTPLAPLFEGLGGTAAHLLGRRRHRQPGQGNHQAGQGRQDMPPSEPARGVMDGERLDAAQVERVSKWPSRTEQLSILLGQILSPGAMLASQLNSVGGALGQPDRTEGGGRRRGSRKPRRSPERTAGSARGTGDVIRHNCKGEIEN